MKSMMNDISDMFLVECSSPSAINPEMTQTGTETFSITTNSALFMLDTELDFEANERYVVIMEVIDNGKSGITGQIVVRVNRNGESCIKCL